ncbi:MAG: hypothetical protein LUQ60_00465 [Methanomicrobiales archaeon]|nr:hypothetical protein [Methanomicrobiales archaeon]
MKRFRMVSLLLVLGILAATPAAALHARYLDIVVDRGGNATVTFEYNLPWIEQVLAFLGAVNPDRDLERIFAATTGGTVATLSAGEGVTTFSVKGFATMTENAPGTTYDTRPLNLSWGKAGYESSILAPLLEPDFSPDVTVIRFPDAYSRTFRDLFLIPNITHSF